MNRLSDNRWFVRLLALFFAILLFVNANAENMKNSTITTSGKFEKSVTNVPIDYRYDQSKYYISGYETSTGVQLKSSNRVLLDMEANEQTKNYSVVADLTKLGVGTHELSLKIEGMNSAVTGTLTLKTVHVTIEKKKTSTFKVEPNIDHKIFSSGYTLDEATVSPEKVTVTAGAETIKAIKKVEAVINDKKNVKEDFSEKVSLKALDKNGEVLSVTIDPVTVNVKVVTKEPSKTVSLKVTQSGSYPKGVNGYSINLESNQAEISGEPSLLENIHSLSVPVMIENITDTVSDYYTITAPSGVKVTPEKVLVTIVPTHTATRESSSSATVETANQTTETKMTNQTSETTSSSTSKSSTSETSTSSIQTNTSESNNDE